MIQCFCGKRVFWEKWQISRIRAFFQMFRADLISRMTAKQIFRGFGQNLRNPRNLIPLKYSCRFINCILNWKFLPCLFFLVAAFNDILRYSSKATTTEVQPDDINKMLSINTSSKMGECPDIFWLISFCTTCIASITKTVKSLVDRGWSLEQLYI